MRIAIVNDQNIALESMKRALKKAPAAEIAWTAYDGAEAVEKCAQDKPDLILMNLIMPVMNGVEATCKIMRENPCPIVIVTSTPDSHKDMVFEAMGCGALDVAATPVLDSSDSEKSIETLLKKITLIGKLIGMEMNTNDTFSSQKQDKNTYPLIAAGSSTGGPKALAAIFKNIPDNIGASFVIVQHVDSRFAGGLAKWLDEQVPLKVEVAREGSSPMENTVHVAGTDDHLVLDRFGKYRYVSEPVSYPYRPSVNEFFKSLSKHHKAPGCAVILTGMGNDGAKGMYELRRKGWHTIAQDAATSVVYGMPKAAAGLQAAKEILPLDKIADSILMFINKRK